jgi:hypothetical protein|nr:MAG TPA: hypothetical protein [Caudoviricetes sp.]
MNMSDYEITTQSDFEEFDLEDNDEYDYID